ncbi:hypothetical protein [Pseudorhodobacter antarcticus]|jgi:hypothetical protein|uniref:hypothetical protein n=1 Tax=Pseudorhodobacter antarcticus TaxID=1077947 RepID=UPI001587958D|nr:hypothetical protein [Pseudorhodobacter antarcticus]
MGGTLLPHKNSQHFAAPPRDTTKPNQRRIKSPVFLERLNCRAIFLRLILPLLENKAKYVSKFDENMADAQRHPFHPHCE